MIRTVCSGAHEFNGRMFALVHLPAARTVRLERGLDAPRIQNGDFFAWSGTADDLNAPYSVSWTDAQGTVNEQVDPYCFGSSIDPLDLTAFAAGEHRAVWRFLGAHELASAGFAGVRFAVWAPNAERVSVVGPFCRWDGRRFPMRALGTSGVWEIFIPGLARGELYMFEIRQPRYGRHFSEV
jgi:1,4-alpha-glucan branching enzyme